MEENGTQARINVLGACDTQLETMKSIIKKEAITFDALIKRLIDSSDAGSNKIRKPCAKRILTPEEKAAFHACMVAGRLAKEKSHNASKK